MSLTSGCRFLGLLLLVLADTTTSFSGKFWHISDIHYDPTVATDMRSCRKAVKVIPKYSSEFCDSNLELVKSAIRGMRRIESQPDFIIWTGDSALHYLNGNVGTEVEIVNILKDLSLWINASFPGIPVIASLGNHDFVPDNQLPAVINDIYTNISMHWEGLGWFKGDVAGELPGAESFKQYGSYSVRLSSGLLAVALNTNYYYLGNKVFEDLPEDPGNQLAMLERLLKMARANSTKLLITAHVPFGVGAEGEYIHMYQKYNARFVSLVREYHDVIMGSFFGHEHIDAFKLVFNEDGTTALSTAFLAPSITPWRFKIPSFEQPYRNPGIRLVDYNSNTFLVKDYTQYYFDLAAANNGENITWSFLYKFTTAYGVPDASTASAHKAAEKVRSGSKLLEYMRAYYCKKEAEPCSDKCRAGISCAIFEVSQAGAAQCVKDINDDTSGGGRTTPLWSAMIMLFLMLIVAC